MSKMTTIAFKLDGDEILSPGHQVVRFTEVAEFTTKVYATSTQAVVSMALDECDSPDSVHIDGLAEKLFSSDPVVELRVYDLRMMAQRVRMEHIRELRVQLTKGVDYLNAHELTENWMLPRKSIFLQIRDTMDAIDTLDQLITHLPADEED